MDTQITLTLPDELYEQASRWAAITRRDLPETITDVLSLALAPAHAVSRLEKPVASLSDGDVLALSRAQMRPAQGRRLSELLSRQRREGMLDEQERLELLALMQMRNQLWIRQSEALAEVVRRGLRKPIR